MSGQLARLNVVSKEYSGNTTLPRNTSRGYFFIVMTTGTATIEFGEGGGTIPLAADAFLEPIVAPTSQIDIVSAGTYTILTNGH